MDARNSEPFVSLPRDVHAVFKSIAGLRTLAAFVATIAALYFAREVLMPLALAVLLSFALGPLVVLLRRMSFGRVPSVLTAVLLAFVVISGIASLLGSQLAILAENLPQYQTNITEKIRSVRSTTSGSGIVGRASAILRDLGSEITSTAPPVGATPAPPAGQPPAPIPVEIHQAVPTTIEMIRSIVGPLLQPLATAGIVVIFVIFFLLQREDLRDRFIRLAGARDLQRTTEGLDDAARRVSRYLLAQAAINSLFGLLIGTGLWLIGVPNPLLWGILAMLLRFVPYIGPVIAAMFPLALALAVDPGWSMVLWTGALFLIVEPILGQAVEPLLYGHSTGLSAVAIVVAAAFWTWLWGPVGLLLSTPFTLCLVVIGRHVERLEFFDVILGDKPALTLEEKFYQRMLANDPDDTAQQAEAFLKEHTLSDYYEQVAIPGLALAQADINRGVLEQARRTQIKDAVLELIDDLAEHAGPKEEAGPARMPQAADATSAADQEVALCVGGRGALDEAVAAILMQLLNAKGIVARVVPCEAVTAANLPRLDMSNVQMVCLSYLEPGGFSNARYLVRRLRRRLPVGHIITAFWTLSAQEAQARDAVQETGADVVVTSVREALDAMTAAAAKLAVRTEVSRVAV